MNPQESHLSEARKRFLTIYRQEKYKDAANEIHNLLLNILLKIYTEAKAKATGGIREEIEKTQLEIFGGRDTNNISLKELAALFHKLNILEIAEGNETDRNLLKAFSLMELVDLSEQSLHDSDDRAKKYLFTIYAFVVALLSFNGEVDPTGDTSSTKSNIIDRTFSLNLDTGIMVNPHDLTRNVSFKAVTFSVMIGHICTQVVNKVLAEYNPADLGQNVRQIEESLNTILSESGYNAGSNFGEALTKDFQREAQLSLHQKIKLWCEFDTSVGWGKFEDELIVDESIKRVQGKVVLQSNFLVAEKTRLDFNLCSLMKGYIKGVLEKLLGFSVNVEHKRDSNCAQFNPDKQFCDFLVSEALP